MTRSPKDADGERVQLVDTDLYGTVTRTVQGDGAAVDVQWDDGRASFSACGALLRVGP